MKEIFTALKQFFRSLDLFLVLTVLACCGIGLLMQYSFYATGERDSRAFLVQVIGVAGGLVLAMVISIFDYELLARMWKLYAPIIVLLVVITYSPAIGYAPNPDAPTDHAWLNLGFTTFQPSELMKVAFILTLAYHLSKVREHINELRPFLLLCVHGMIPVVLVVIQSDFGTALVFLIIFAVMMFSAGLSLRWIAVGVGSAAAAFPFVWIFLLDDFLKERFLVAWHPENYIRGKGYQQYRGRMALGAGQMYGRGLRSGELIFVPEARNDFIFSYIGQTLGFVGCVITLLLLTCLCVRILVNARMSKDQLGCYICIGAFAMFAFQAVINIGMVLCAIPVIGITLPFFSSGGTSVMISFAAVGLVLSVYRKNRRKLMFD